MSESQESPPDVATVDAGRQHSHLVSELLKTLMMALILFLTARLLVLPYQVDGKSMAPNLEDRERVLVNRAVYMHVDLDRWLDWIPGVDASDTAFYPFHAPEPGDIVVINPPEYSPQPYIKRIIAVGGDVVDVHDGHVYVNGRQLPESYISGAITDCGQPRFCHNFTVPESSIYVLGDNRQHSSDSREFGPVPLDNVIGKAWFANWPSDRIGLLPDYDYDNSGN